MRVEHGIYTIPLRIRSLFRRAQVERELDEELQYHLDRQVDEYVARGMSAADACTEALRALGGVERRKDECRDARGMNRLDNLRRDARFATRLLRRTPGFTFVAACTLALGIGASTAIFTVVDALLLRPLPYYDPSRLVMLRDADVTVAAATFLDWKAATRTAERMSAAEYWTPNLDARRTDRQGSSLRVFARIQSGVSLLQTRGDLAAVGDRLARQSLRSCAMTAGGDVASSLFRPYGPGRSRARYSHLPRPSDSRSERARAGPMQHRWDADAAHQSSRVRTA
jgi:hypothetical protein